MKWIPILICTHWACSGEPIQGKPMPTYEECKQVLDLTLALYGDFKFTEKYIVTKCERTER